MRKQQGISLLGMVVIGMMAAFALLLAAKLVPAYVEYFAVQKNLATLVNENRNSGPAEIRAAFDRRAIIDDITSFKSDELEIEQSKEGLGIAVSYDKIVHLFANIHILIKFHTAAGTAAEAEQKK